MPRIRNISVVETAEDYISVLPWVQYTYALNQQKAFFNSSNANTTCCKKIMQRTLLVVYGEMEKDSVV